MKILNGTYSLIPCSPCSLLHHTELAHSKLFVYSYILDRNDMLRRHFHVILKNWLHFQWNWCMSV